MKRIILLGLLLAGNIGLRAAGTEGLRCEYLDNPLGIDVTSPRLSWKVVSGKRGDCQTAYRILVASSAELLKKDRGDLWDSGRVPSDRSIQVEYAGKPLESRMRCYWKVQVWDAAGKAGPWSEPAMWSMGLLTERDWGGARWIAYRDDAQWREQWQAHKDRENSHREPTWPWFVGTGRTIWELYDMASPHYDPSPLFRKEFALGKKVKAATLYVTGVGYYEAFLNGKKIGDHVLDPAWTNFHKRTFYVTYDVTADVRRGDNALGIMVGRGQYNPLCNDIWRLGSSLWVGQPKAIALLSVEYADGTTADIVTDGSWTTAGGPILYDDTRHGELYDAREEKAGWNRPGFVADGWRPAAVVDGSGPLYAQMMPPVRCFAPIAPVKTFDKGNGRTAYDIGRNIAGWARVRVSGPAGARVLVEYCELPSDPELVPDIHPSKMKFKIGDPDYASFYDKSINIRQQNGYILKGGGPETFECRFSYKGFQYIRVTADEGVTVERVEGVPVHTDVADAGSFVCSNETVNRLHPDRLSAPREAGLDGRYLYDRPDGDLQFRYGGFLCEMGDRSGRYGRPERRTVHRGAVDRVRPEHFDRVAGRHRVRAVGSAVLLRRPPRGGAALRNDEAFRRKQPAASGGRQAGDHPRGARRLGVAAHDAVRYAAIL